MVLRKRGDIIAKKATTIAIVNQKGGTAKTTTCENLGIGLAMEGKKVLLVDALKNQGARSDLTSPQIAAKFRSDDAVAKSQGVSGDTVQRYVRLTNLIPELLNMVDEKKVSFNPAVELSYLSAEQQQEMIKAMDDTQNAPSVSQAKRIKKLAQAGKFTSDAVVAIMGEEKKSELDTVTIKNETLRKYFPRSYTPRQMEEKIIQLLDAWQKKQQRKNER